MIWLRVKPFDIEHRNPLKMILVTFFSSLYLYNHLGTLYVLDRGLSLLEKQSLASIMILTIFVSEVPTGMMADRVGRKRSILIALFCQLTGEIVYLFATNYTLFAICSVVGGIGWAFLSGSAEALMYDSLPKADRENTMKSVMGLMGSSYQLAFLLAPIIAGFFVAEYELQNFRMAVALTALSVLIALVVATTLEEPKRMTVSERQDFFLVCREGMSSIVRNKRLWRITLVSIFTVAYHGSLVGLYQPYFDQYGVSALWIGLTLSAGALLAVFTEKNAYRIEDLLGKKLGLFTAVVLPGLLYITFGLVSHTAALVIIFVVAYSTVRMRDPLLSAYKNELIPSETRATILSLINMLSSLFVATVGLSIGWVADWSLSFAFIFMGTTIIFSAVTLRAHRIPQEQIVRL